LFELIDQVGFPPGVAQLVLGAGDPAGSTLAASDRVDKIAFTGGTSTGRKIMIAAAGNLKKISLEFGGKIRTPFSPMLIPTSPSSTLCLPSTQGREKSAAPDRG
jgi:hypothetical protein